MNTTTKKLQDILTHCIGRKTVIFENDTVYHFNSPIVTISGYNLILNSYYYDYSQSTGRVRNAAMRYFSGYKKVPTLAELKAAHKNGEVLTMGIFNILFSDWSICD